MPSPIEAFEQFELGSISSGPFLRLPKPLDKIIVTPPRLSDIDTIVKYLNDPRIYKSLDGVHHPDIIWEQIKQSDSDGRRVFDGCPVRSIREVNEDGSQTFLGDCGISRWGYHDVIDKVEREKLAKENQEREVGDPQIIWMIGDYIAASHHGRGIMSAVLKIIMDKWATPWMAARHIKSEAHQGNIGSRRVFEKNGFVVVKTLENYVEIAESKGGGLVGLHVMDWKYNGAAA